MELYSPDRPKTSSGLPSLLNGGPYIVPIVNVFPLPDDKIELRVFVPSPGASGFTFSPKRVEIFTKDLPEFFDFYRTNPEQALKDYFGWEMTALPKPTRAPKPQPVYDPQLDLL